MQEEIDDTGQVRFVSEGPMMLILGVLRRCVGPDPTVYHP